jgi:transcriptional regulator with XRE-family HTH domain
MPIVDHATVGPRLKAARLRRGMTQDQIAHRLKMTGSNISRIEGGAYTSVENVAAYAAAVGGEVAVVVACPDDRLEKLAAKMARLIPRFDLEADASLIETLESWSATWERKHLAATGTKG